MPLEAPFNVLTWGSLGTLLGPLVASNGLLERWSGALSVLLWHLTKFLGTLRRLWGPSCSSLRALLRPSSCPLVAPYLFLWRSYGALGALLGLSWTLLCGKKY